uniref:ribosomal protein L4 n=1 Tax=Fibrocapsa japonica TaxID=94617 RepID=UPI0021151276|nr:ribosomal protein L4 [Fibrocapsa japonica]UTE95158.1 ribosomal protein L4 [Fibrocapsa japonica]
MTSKYSFTLLIQELEGEKQTNTYNLNNSYTFNHTYDLNNSYTFNHTYNRNHHIPIVNGYGGYIYNLNNSYKLNHHIPIVNGYGGYIYNLNNSYKLNHHIPIVNGICNLNHHIPIVNGICNFNHHIPIVNGIYNLNNRYILNLKVKETKRNFLVHRVLIKELNNVRQGTAATKTRAEIRGGGKKPWRQKGTGKARAGSNRSPLWRGGGVSFGPKPKNYKKKINKNEWRLALQTLLVNKKNSIILVGDTFNIFNQTYRTKNFFKNLENLSVPKKEKILFIVPFYFQNLLISTKNLKNVKIVQANCLNIKNIIDSKTIITCVESLKKIEEIYGKRK